MPPKASTSAKRILRELASLSNETPEGVTAGLKSNASVYEWQGSVLGPADSVYEGGLYNFDIHLPFDYPFNPPQVRFLTRIYHPNVNASGGICLDILKHNWSPALSILKVLLSISSLLTDPNPHDPLVADVARLFLTNRPQFDETAREWTKLYAVPPPKPKPAPVPVTIPPPVSQTPSKIKPNARSFDDDEIREISSMSSSSASVTMTRSTPAAASGDSSQHRSKRTKMDEVIDLVGDSPTSSTISTKQSRNTTNPTASTSGSSSTSRNIPNNVIVLD